MILLFWNFFGLLSGYQFDCVFDWTVLKYPQIGPSSRGRVSDLSSLLMFLSLEFCLLFWFLFLFQQHMGKTGLNAGPSAEKDQRTSGLYPL